MSTGLKFSSMNMIEENVIPLRFRIDNLTIVIAILFASSVLFQYVFYELEGRRTNYLPTFAETASSAPNSMVFSAVLSCLSFLIFLVMNAVVTWGEVYDSFQQKFLWFGQFCSFICPIFLFILGNFRPDDWPWAEYIGIIPFFFFSLVFCALLLSQVFRQISTKVKTIRVILLAIAAVALLFAFIPFPMVFSANCSKTAICQLLFFAAILTFLITWKSELNQLKIDVLIFSEDA
jgi:hypothetical protein